MSALPSSMPHCKSIIFYRNSPKIKLFLQKNAKFSSAGGSAPSPMCLQQLGAQILKHFPPLPPLRISCYVPGHMRERLNVVLI